MSNKRHNLINFRLSDEEHESLKAAAFAHGSPSVSEYLRNLVQTSVEGKLHPQASAELQPSHLDRNIVHLQSTIRQLSALLEEIGSAFVREAMKQVVSAGPKNGNS